jgi:hypothetical protein
MAFTCNEIIEAFLRHEGGAPGDLDLDETAEHAASGAGGVSLALRCADGPGGGYVRVWGPSATPAFRSSFGSYVVVERKNGVVGLHDKLAPFVPNLATRRSDVNINVDPLGYGCGPKYGHYTKAIPSTAMGPGQTYPTPASLVQSIVAAFGRGGVAW